MATRNLELVRTPAQPRIQRPPGDRLERNPGMELDLDVVRAIRVNRSAVERRAATIPTRRTVKKQWQAAWLLRAITLMDLTTLSGDDTDQRVRRLCAKAKQPVQQELVKQLGIDWNATNFNLGNIVFSGATANGFPVNGTPGTNINGADINNIEVPKPGGDAGKLINAQRLLGLTVNALHITVPGLEEVVLV